MFLRRQRTTSSLLVALGLIGSSLTGIVHAQQPAPAPVPPPAPPAATPSEPTPVPSEVAAPNGGAANGGAAPAASVAPAEVPVAPPAAAPVEPPAPPAPPAPPVPPVVRDDRTLVSGSLNSAVPAPTPAVTPSRLRFALLAFVVVALGALWIATRTLR